MTELFGGLTNDRKQYEERSTCMFIPNMTGHGPDFYRW